MKKLVVNLKLPGWGALLGKSELAKVKLPYTVVDESSSGSTGSPPIIYGSFTLVRSGLPSIAPHPGSFKSTTSFFTAFNY